MTNFSIFNNILRCEFLELGRYQKSFEDIVKMFFFSMLVQYHFVKDKIMRQSLVFLHFKKGLASVSHDKRIAHIWPIVSECIMTMHSLLEILKGQVILHGLRQRFQKILKVQSRKLKKD